MSQLSGIDITIVNFKNQLQANENKLTNTSQMFINKISFKRKFKAGKTNLILIQ